MTNKYVSFLLFTNGHMIDGGDVVDYDQPPCGNFSMNLNSWIVFEQFLQMVRLSLTIDMSSSNIEIIYRHPNLTSSGSVRFMSIPISNEQAMNTMFSIAQLFSNMVHLYVTVSRVDLGINLM